MPTSIAISPAYSIWRSLMSSAARLRISSRRSQPSRNHAGCARRAAAIASWTSARVPFANVPTRMSLSIGERSSNVPSPSRSAPSMKFRWTWPSRAFARSSPASYCACSSSLSSRRVA